MKTEYLWPHGRSTSFLTFLRVDRGRVLKRGAVILCMNSSVNTAHSMFWIGAAWVTGVLAVLKWRMSDIYNTKCSCRLFSGWYFPSDADLNCVCSSTNNNLCIFGYWNVIKVFIILNLLCRGKDSDRMFHGGLRLCCVPLLSGSSCCSNAEYKQNVLQQI